MIRVNTRNHLKMLILTSLVFFFIGFSISKTEAQTISIRADIFFPVSGNPYDERPGYMIEIAQAILADKGVTVEYQTMPWARSLILAEKGLIDCIVGAYKSKDRTLIYPSLPWGKDQNLFYVAKNSSWRFSGMSSLKDLRIGIIHGYSYSPDFDDFAKQTENQSIFEYTFGLSALEQNISKLLAGRIDATIETNLVMPKKLKELNLENDIIPAGKLNTKNDLYIACSPTKTSSRKYLQWFDEGIQKLRASGRLKLILQRYQLTDWEAPSAVEKYPGADALPDGT